MRGALRILSLACLLAAVARHGAAQDFTEARMREGVDAYQSKRPADAVIALRIAVFGYLDRPPQLCRALIYLAIAEDASGRRTEALSAANRLRDVQRRAATCAEAPVDDPVRAEFESRFGRPPFGEGAAAPAVAGVAGRAAPPPREREASAGPAATPASPVADSSPENVVAAGELDVPPKIRTRFPAVYPRAVREANITGTVVLRVLVSETGRPERVETLKGIRPLAEAAMASLRRWTFEPARRAGREVPAWLVVEVPFQR